MSNDNPNYFVPAGASHASRKVSLKSSVSNRGFLLNTTCDRWAGSESTLETDFLSVALAHPKAVLIQEQPKPVIFFDKEGNRRTHTFDFHVQFRGGRTIAYDIKPEKRLVRSGIEADHRLIRQQHPTYADKIVVRTDRQISRVQVRNSTLIRRARQLRDEEAIEKLRQHLASMHGFFPFASLVALFDLEADGFNAVLNLIDMQELKPVTRRRPLEETELEICKAA